MLIRCRDCNSSVKEGETRCYACGSQIKSDDGAKAAFAKKFATIIKLAFFGSAALTIASLFFEFTPSFMKCLTTTLILLFVKSSADAMLEKSGG